MNIKLEALFDGDDPFEASKPKEDDTEIDMDDLDKHID